MALQQTVMERGMNDENIRNANFTNSNEETNKIGITKSTAIIGRVILGCQIFLLKQVRCV